LPKLSKHKQMKTSKLLFLLGIPVVGLMLFSCSKTIKPTITAADFGVLPSGETAKIYTLTNSNGHKATITDFGAKLVSLEVPDKNGNLADVILGYETLDQYLKGDPYFGSTVGRFANRIAKGKFSIDGTEYSLALNNGVNHLHGGPLGYHSVLWQSEVVEVEGYPALKLTYHSPDMEEGYPGNLDIELIYIWKDDNSLYIDYTARTDKPTIVNLTHHSLFNLKGAGNGDILGHILTIPAGKYTPVDSTLIPTGVLDSVAGTPMDFTKPHRIGDRINDTYPQLVIGKGYDHNWVLDKGSSYDLAASLYEPESGRVMDVYSSEPGIQFYSGNFLDGSQVGKGGKPYQFRYGLALETQHYPDSPNQPAFPTVRLNPGETYKQLTVYRFSVQ